MPKRLIWLFTVLMLFAAACGGSEDAVAGDTGDTTETAEQADADVEFQPTVTPVPSGDALDLTEKPAVAGEFLVDVSELVLTDLVEGTGQEAAAGSNVALQYVGVLASDGTQFDASWDRGAEPITFTLGTGQVINGWDEGIEGMQVGGRRVLQIPAVQAYGDASPSAAIPPGADLVLSLLHI